MIEAVQADQPGPLDQVDTLGTQLTPTQQKHRQQLWREREQATKDPKKPETSTNPSVDSRTQASRQKAIELQWPTLALPAEKRMLKRKAEAALADAARPIFTPDFSRQRLTLASIAGRSVVDLPLLDMADSVASTPVAQKDVDKMQAVSLADLVGIGLSYSPVMDQVQAQLANAMAQSKQARSDLLPSLSTRYAQGPEHSRTTAGVDKHTTQSTSVRMTQPLFNMPVISDWHAALSEERAANWRVHASRETVALSVAQATINLATARMVLDYSDEQLKQFSQLLDYVQARAQTGATSAADLERTRTRVLLARQVRIEQQAQYKNALLELTRLTGQSPEALQLPYLNQLPALPATQGELRRVANDFSYDLRALREEIEAQRQTVTSQKSKLLPVLGLSLEHDTGKNARGVNARQTDNRVMAVMTWQMSLGGTELYAADAARSELSNREAKLTEEVERILQSIDADFASLQSATLRVTAGQAEQLASGAVVESVNAQLRTGRLGSLLEALDAYERHYASRQRSSNPEPANAGASAIVATHWATESDARPSATGFGPPHTSLIFDTTQESTHGCSI
jgi:protease secretion system outer membrane protein